MWNMLAGEILSFSPPLSKQHRSHRETYLRQDARSHFPGDYNSTRVEQEVSAEK